MPCVGDRQRAAVVVGMVAGILFLVGNLSFVLPAAAQGMTLPSTPTSVTVAPSASTTIERSPSTTVVPTTISARPRSTTTTRDSASPSTTARRVTPSTTAARTGMVSGLDDSPATTDRQRPSADSSVSRRTTTTTSDLALEQAASSSGLSTGSLVALVVAGLLAVALALSLLTVRYVRATQPGDRSFD